MREAPGEKEYEGMSLGQVLRPLPGESEEAYEKRLDGLLKEHPELEVALMLDGVDPEKQDEILELLQNPEKGKEKEEGEASEDQQ